MLVVVVAAGCAGREPPRWLALRAAADEQCLRRDQRRTEEALQ